MSHGAQGGRYTSYNIHALWVTGNQSEDYDNEDVWWFYMYYFMYYFMFYFFMMNNLSLYSGHSFTMIFQAECMGYGGGSVVLSKIAFSNPYSPSDTHADPIVRGFYLLRLTASCFDSNIFLRQKHARRLRITNTVWVSK